MVKKNKPKDDEIYVESSPLSAEDERLDKLFDEMEAGSLKTLEDAARQIITLSTTLLGLFFGLLAFKDAPSYLGFFEIKFIGGLAVVCFMGSLYFASLAVTLKRYTFSRANLTEKRKILEDILARKGFAVSNAGWLFVIGELLMLIIVLDVLVFRL